MNKLNLKSLGLVVIVLFATGGLASANLIVNGGFETGNFDGWTHTPFTSVSSFGVTTGEPHTGCCNAYFETSGSDLDAISQTFATTAGVFYDLSFWLANPFGPSDNEFRVTFGGVVVQDLINAGIFGYTPYSFSVLGTGSPLTLEFAGRNGGAFFDLDDVSVEARSATAPEAGSSALLLGAALMGLILIQRRTRGSGAAARPRPARESFAVARALPQPERCNLSSRNRFRLRCSMAA